MIGRLGAAAAQREEVGIVGEYFFEGLVVGVYQF